MEIGSPIGRVEAPMASSIFSVPMAMTDKLSRAKKAFTFQALDASGRGRSIGLRQDDSATFAKALVLHPKTERAGCGVEPHGRSHRWTTVQ